MYINNYLLSILKVIKLFKYNIITKKIYFNKLYI